MFKTYFFRFSIPIKKVLCSLNIKKFSSKFYAPGSPYVKEGTDKIYPKLPNIDKTITLEDLENSFKNICNLIRQEQDEDANIEANRFLNECMIMQNEKYTCKAYLLLGSIQAKRQEYLSAIEKFECAFDIIKTWEVFDDIDYIDLMKNLSICHEMLKEYDKSIEYAKQVMAFAKKPEYDFNFSFDVFQNLTRLYKLSEKYEDCLDTCLEMQNLMNSKNINTILPKILVETEKLEMKIKLNKDGVKHLIEELNQILLLSNEIKEDEVLLKIYYNLALLYINEKDACLSSKMASKALELVTDYDININYELMHIISSNHLLMKEYKQAIQTFNQLFEFIKKNYNLHLEENLAIKFKLEETNKSILKICMNKENISIIKENNELIEIFKSSLIFRFNSILMERDLYKNISNHSDDIKFLIKSVSHLKEFINVDTGNNILLEFHKKLKFLKFALNLNCSSKEEVGEDIIKELEFFK
jgi:tetratricopeptide (TPR) repeat protein